MERHAGAHDITLGELKLNRTRLCPIKETAALVCFEFVTRSSAVHADQRNPYKTSRNKARSFCRSFRNFMAYVSWNDSRAWRMVTRYLLSRSSSFFFFLLFQDPLVLYVSDAAFSRPCRAQIAPVIISSSSEWCQSTAFRAMRRVINSNVAPFITWITNDERDFKYPMLLIRFN